MAIRAVPNNPVNLLVLATLVEGPMHPYEIQRLAMEREKTSVQGVKRGSMYHAVQRLEAAGLIEAIETSRDGRRPERTVYRITDDGRDEVHAWLNAMLRRPKAELPELVNALEYIALLTPAEVAAALEHRVFLLDRELGGARATLQSIGDKLPRIFIIETEYAQALKQAERDWVAAILEDIQAGRLSWSWEQLDEWAKASPLAGIHRPEPEGGAPSP